MSASRQETSIGSHGDPAIFGDLVGAWYGASAGDLVGTWQGDLV